MVVLKKQQLDRFVYIALRLLLGGIFAYAGFAKLMEPVANFRGALAQYEIFPLALLDPVAYTVPWVEFIFGCFVIVGYAPRWSSLVLGMLSASFVVMLLMSKSFWGTGAAYCGCFGQAGLKLSMRQMALLDLFNTLIGLRFFFLKSHPISLHSLLVRSA